MPYLLCKWLHIVAVISWMCGVLYLYRLLIYLAERGDHPDIKALLILMARRLYKYITVPAAVTAVLAGAGMLAIQSDFMKTGWFGLKFLAVLGVLHFTVYGGQLIGRFERGGANLPSSRSLRIMNEVPTILMILIVAMVVFKPF